MSKEIEKLLVEAETLLKKEAFMECCAAERCEECVTKALLLLKQQPTAGDLTEHIRKQVRCICEMMQGKHEEEVIDWEALLTQVLALCGSYDKLCDRLDSAESINADLLEICEEFMERADNGSVEFDDPVPGSIYLRAPIAIAKAKKEGSKRDGNSN